MGRVWYVAYGSNVGPGRFHCYLAGGRPPGGSRDYPGCRDTGPPAAELAVELPGRLVFAGASRVWGGGLALYDVRGDGTVAGRAYLVTTDQFADVAAQEMWREPGGDFAASVADVLATLERMHVLGPGRYETVHRVGEHDGVPMLTITTDDVAALPPAAPAPAYLWWIGTGIADAHGWSSGQVAAYLAKAPGAAGVWTEETIEELVGQPRPPSAR